MVKGHCAIPNAAWRCHDSASFLYISRILGQPPSTSRRIDAPASAPIRSNLRCSSSTVVAFGPSATKRTSTSELTDVSGFHLLLISQLTTKRCGGSQASTLPTVASDPSSLTSYQRPPSRVSKIDVLRGGL